jgi:peptide/nickel transport system substrate-binding protein
MNKKIIKMLVLALCVVMALALASCGSGGGGSSTSQTGGSSAPVTDASSSGGGDVPVAAETSVRDKMRIAVSTDSGSLDPLGMSGQGGFLDLQMVYMEPLFDYTTDLEQVWLLCTGIEYISDTEFIYHLREGVTFSNGNPFTASDVLFTFGLYRADPVKLLNVQALDLENTKAIDDYTVEVHYTEANVAEEMMLCQVLMFDEESYDKQAIATQPIGTGSYRVTDYVTNSHIYLEARDDYWGGTPKIKNLEFICLNEPAQIVNALEIGDIDYAHIMAKDAEYIESLGNFEVVQNSIGMDYCAYYNLSPDGPLNSLDARNAISHAIDRESIKDVALSGYGVIPRWPVAEVNADFNPDRFANQDDTYTIGYDLEKAKELAEKAGLIGKTVKMITNGDEDYVTAAEIIQADLKSIGINAEIVNYDQATYFATLMDANNFDIGLYSTSAPSFMAADIFYSYPMFLPLGWDEAERNAYIQEGKEVLMITDDAAREDALYNHVQNFYKYNLWYGIVDTVALGAVSKDIDGFEYALLGGVNYKDLVFTA